MPHNHEGIVFRHFRKMDLSGNINPRGGCTAALLQQDSGDILVSLAHCSPKDAFIKRLGRDKSAGRLYSDHDSWNKFTIYKKFGIDLKTQEGRKAAFFHVKQFLFEVSTHG